MDKGNPEHSQDSPAVGTSGGSLLARRPKYKKFGLALVALLAVVSGYVIYNSQAATAVTGLSATYYNNPDFTGTTASRVDPQINFDWGTASPASKIDPGTFSVRWAGFLTAPKTGVYQIFTDSDDGVRVWVGSEEVVNSWTTHGTMNNSGSLSLTAGQKYAIKVEYYNGSGAGSLALSWKGPGFATSVVPSSVLSASVQPSPSITPSPTSTPKITPTPRATPSPTPPVGAQVMLMGVSNGPNDHGGTEDWDVWRVYNEGSMLSLANRTGNLRPLALAYSEGSANLGDANPNYTSVHDHVLAKLNSFYYTSATGQTHSARWNIKLFWSNGNENFDKGALALPHTAAGIAAYTTSQRALYEAVHYIDPSTGQRRFPDAYAGSDPTHNAELSGLVEDWLTPSAQYHDFVMWSMYPPGRKSTPSDPTFNWPTFTESQQSSAEGFLIRTFSRTKQAEAAAGHPLMIAVGEIGIGNDPNDGTTRPYYVAYGLAHSLMRLSEQYNLAIPFACWWDNQTDASSPQNILSDEQAGLNPTTRQAWQNWAQYDHLRGGTLPSSWQGNPKSGWKVSGVHPTL